MVSGQSNVILLVAVSCGTSSVTSVTYGGVALAQLATVNEPVSGVFQLWYLLNPPTGANNVVITVPSTTFIVGDSASYYSVAQSSTFGTVATSTGSTSPSSNTVTTTAITQLVIDVIDNQAVSTDTATASQTKRFQPATSGVALGDKAATGSNMTLTWSFTSSNWGQISVAMNPFPPAPPVAALAYARDGHTSASARDGKVSAFNRDGHVGAKGV